MSSEITEVDFLEHYKNTSNRLKKRFLRKPNVADASNSFSQLAQQCELFDLLPYAGLSWIAAAQCEGSMGNIPGELSYLTKSASNFHSCELKNSKLGYPSPSKANLQAAVGSYTHTNSKLPDKSPLGVGLNLKIVESLNELELIEEKDIYLQKAVELSQNYFDGKTLSLLLVAENAAKKGEFLESLKTFTEISELIEKSPSNGFYRDIMLKCEINRLLIFLILRPTPNLLASESTKLLEKYIWGDQIDQNLKKCGMSEDMFLLLQSLVLTCQSLDTSCLVNLEGDLWDYFDVFQKELLRTLVQIYYY